MSEHHSRLRVVHGKFFSYLSWSQPFLYDLLRLLALRTRSVIVTSRTEHLDRFPTRDLFVVDTRYLVDEPLVALAAAEAQRRWQPHLLHGHFGWSGLRMLPLRQLLRIPLVTTFGGRDVGEQLTSPDFVGLYKTLIEASDRVVCVSDFLRDRAIEAGADDRRTVVIRRGTDLARFHFVDRAGRTAGRVLKLLMVGRLVSKKGHRFAIAALDRLIRDGVRARLTIVGDGPLKAPILAQARESGVAGHLDLVGSTDHPGVLEHLTDADLFIHCSVTAEHGDVEGLGNAIIEASATGLPVIATRHGGIVEVVRDQHTGLLVDEADDAALAGAIGSLATDPERRLRMGAAAHAHVRSEFDLARQVDRHLELYHEVVDQYPPGSPRMQQTFTGERLFADLRRVFKGGAGYGDASPIELLVWQRRHSPSKPIFRDPRPDALEFAWALRRLVPGVLRTAATRAFEHTVHRRANRVRREAGDRGATDPLRSAVHRYIEAGGSLAAIDPSWSLDELAGYLECQTTRPARARDDDRAGPLT